MSIAEQNENRDDVSMIDVADATRADAGVTVGDEEVELA